MEINGAFEYGGYHFIPERQLTSEEKDFASISKRQKLDLDLGFYRENYAYPCRHHYSHESFYAASPDKTATCSAALRMAGCIFPVRMICRNTWNMTLTGA